MSYNPHVDANGNCVNCGTGQLNFDGKSTGCACSRVADAEYETEQRIIKLLEERSKCGYEHDYNGFCFCEEIALIKGENK